MKRIALALATIAVTSAGYAAEPLALPGGPSDPRHPNYLILSGEPKAGDVPDTAACKLTARYMELVSSGRVAEVAGLFADDAYFFEPASQSVTRGRAEIDAFFNRTIGPMKPEVVGVSYFGSGNDCGVEIAVKTRWNGETQFTIVSLDHFTLGGDGKFSRMIAFTRPMPPGMLPASIPPEMVPELKGYTPPE